MPTPRGMTDTERARHRARQLLAQPPELLNVRDLRSALEQLLDAADHLTAEIEYLVTSEDTDR